jgi:4'-phosphopantetheinyl transferase
MIYNSFDPKDKSGLTPLSLNEVHLWTTEIDDEPCSKLKKKYLLLLDEEEQKRYQGFYFAEHRHQFLISHAFLRLVLSQYQAIAPTEWCFKRGEYGRPEISNTITQSLRFNLTHTKGMALCAITLGRNIGVDVENKQRLSLDSNLEKTVLSMDEDRVFQQQESKERLSCFLKYWTLKEAYLKARGIGLAVSPDKIIFDLAGSYPTVRFHKTIKDKPGAWHFVSLDLPKWHIGAIAVQGSIQPHLVYKNAYRHLVM